MDKAKALYATLGGIVSADARVVRALMERWSTKESEINDLKRTIKGLHSAIGLAHEVAHEHLKEAGIEFEA